VVWRFPTEDVEVAGVAIPCGDPVLPLISAANRDPAAFADPDGFDIDRTDLDHVSFGYGPHFCVGARWAGWRAASPFQRCGHAFPAYRWMRPATNCGSGARS
jgi:cytochrome P450